MDIQELNEIIKRIKKPGILGTSVKEILKELDKD